MKDYVVIFFYTGDLKETGTWFQTIELLRPQRIENVLNTFIIPHSFVTTSDVFFPKKTTIIKCIL